MARAAQRSRLPRCRGLLPGHVVRPHPVLRAVLVPVDGWFHGIAGVGHLHCEPLVGGSCTSNRVWFASSSQSSFLLFYFLLSPPRRLVCSCTLPMGLVLWLNQTRRRRRSTVVRASMDVIRMLMTGSLCLDTRINAFVAATPRCWHEQSAPPQRCAQNIASHTSSLVQILGSCSDLHSDS